MSLIRPEARAAIWRWREVLVGAVVTALGANWALTAYGVLGWIGWPVLLAGLALLAAGLQRARVRPRSGGAGVVELDEAQLSYFLPEGGVVVPLAQVVRIEIETAPGDVLVWIFTDAAGERAFIPASAVGAERLLDALAQFPGASYNRVIEASGATGRNSFVIWQKKTSRLH
ncbi:hypothetical protein [Marimonas arenosa]|uniref:Uncharacterized protein n=1 Tax=Marimonas arenosa TaxID=1795305 RepID=A0AAE3WFE6_9RHOB|nr:hypothetical protein [Marimonas arenosa]MDQ2091722.1 hypothetical protein [Marimonas arenosa]